MADVRDATHLTAPRLSEMRLQALLDALGTPGRRTVLACFLDDPWRLQGTIEYRTHDLDISSGLADAPRHLAELRHSGWLHQRPTADGLVSRLRRDDLHLRFPDTMRYLHPPAPPGTDTHRADIERRLRRLAA